VLLNKGKIKGGEGFFGGGGGGGGDGGSFFLGAAKRGRPAPLSAARNRGRGAERLASS